MVITKVQIGEFDRFWSTFTTKGSELRAEYGSKGARAFRNLEDPNEIWVILDWDRHQFETFLADPRLAEVMAAAGLKGPPEPVFVEPIGEVAA